MKKSKMDKTEIKSQNKIPVTASVVMEVYNAVLKGDSPHNWCTKKVGNNKITITFSKINISNNNVYFDFSSKSNTNVGVVFIDCDFDFIILNNTKVSLRFEFCFFSCLFESKKDSDYSELYFHGCTFGSFCNLYGKWENVGFFGSKGENLILNGVFEECSISECSCFYLTFRDTIISKKIEIIENRNLTIKTDLSSISNSSKICFDGKVIICENKNIKKIHMNGLSLSNERFIFKNNHVDEMIIENSYFQKDVQVTYSASDSIIFFDNTFKGNCNLENINAKTLSIDISSLETKKRLNIINEKGNESKINRLIFNRLPPRTYLENLNIGELDLSRNTVEDKEILSLTNLNINLLKIKNFINYGFFTINNIKPNGKSKIEIADSNLGKLDLVSCDLREFELQIDNSKLVDIFYTDTFFLKEKGSKEETEIGSNKEDNAKLEQQRDTYGQLKVVSEKVGNRFQALVFQAKEMTAYYKSLEKWTLDKVTLGAMQLSNNFRQSWWQGLGFTLIIGLITYIGFILSLENIEWCIDSWSCVCNTSNVYGSYFSKYFEFLNPAHKSDFLEKENTYGSWTYFWDFMGRILIGFGIYQTIQAFRKFGKE